MDELQQLYTSPIGNLYICANENALTRVLWKEQHIDFACDSSCAKTKAIIDKTVEQLNEYFNGERSSFDLPISLHGTRFQNSVWQALKKISYGETKSYQELAQSINNPKSIRAVGTANSKNPINIIIPCHRVIRKSGELSGYAGGAQRKQQLLSLES